MSHRPMAEHEGQFTAEEKSDRPCPKCGQASVTTRCWESSCGGYEDYRHTCQSCQHSWWVEGIDS